MTKSKFNQALLFEQGLRGCGKCLDIKPINEFPKSAIGSFGLDSKCRCCKSEYNKRYLPDYYRENKEALLKKKKIYNKENFDAIQKVTARYRETHSSEIKAYFKNNYENNKERILLQQKEYYEKNKIVIRDKDKERYLKDPDKFKERSRKNYKIDKKRWKENSKKWSSNNSEKRKIIANKYAKKANDELYDNIIIGKLRRDNNYEFKEFSQLDITERRELVLNRREIKLLTQKLK